MPVQGWEGLYEVSDHGRVRVLERRTADGQTRRARVLRQRSRAGKWRPGVNLIGNGRNVRVAIHPLVLESFEGSRPVGMLCLHWNDDPFDNRLANLRWGTRSDNASDAIRNFGLPPQSRAGRQYRPRSAPFSSIRQLPSGSFQARYRPAGGAQLSASFTTRESAEHLLAEVAAAPQASDIARMFAEARGRHISPPTRSAGRPRNL